MQKQRIIVGIDPGTTAAFAVLNRKGEVLKIHSSKDFGVNNFISEIATIGNPIMIGTDKAKVPRLVSEVASKMGARFISPNEDLKVEEKKQLVKIGTKNDHESDALAAAFFAYNRIKNSIDRITSILKRNKKEHLIGQLLDYVIVKGVGITESIQLLENKNKEEKRIITKVVEENKLHQKDFLRLLEKISLYKKENMRLKKQNSELKQKLDESERQVGSTQNRKIITPKKVKKTLSEKDQSIAFLRNTIRNKEKLVKKQEDNVDELQSIIARINDLFILKKLETLGKDEFESKNKLLNISDNDVLYVKNPDSISEDVVSKLKNIVATIVTDKKPNKIVLRAFTVISSKELSIEEHDYFGLVDKKELQEAIKKNQNFSNIVEEYQETRSHNVLKTN